MSEKAEKTDQEMLVSGNRWWVYLGMQLSKHLSLT
jgi:hypothetical protein